MRAAQRLCKMPTHHLIVGTWTPPGALFTFAFNTDAPNPTLELVKRTEIPHDEPISWLTASHDRKALYGSAMKRWTSFSAPSPTQITQTSSHPMLHDPQASKSDTNTRAIFCLAAKKAPYGVYCNPFYSHAGHGAVFSTSKDGNLDENVQNYEYQPNTGIHGMVFDPSETYLYSADLKANKIWVHKKMLPHKPEVELVGSLESPDERDHPRWVEMHPSGKYLYVLNEHSNTLREFVIDQETHMPVYTHRWWPLIPPGIPDRWTQYRADVVTVSSSGDYLFASSRANSFSLTGYISAFKLNKEGWIERQICINPTPTSGGHSNAVSPCPWSDEWVAVTDDQEGWLDMYRWEGEFLARVARCRVQEPGFGMNAVWYD